MTPGQRFLTRNKQEVSNKKPERRLTKVKHNKKGRNCYGRITSRRRGGGHKRAYRLIDFRRDKLDIPAKVQAIEYDPNRSANLALLAYADGEKRYILAPRGVKEGDVLLNVDKRVEFSAGYSMPLSVIPPATKCTRLNYIQAWCTNSTQLASLQILSMATDNYPTTVGEIRYLNSWCRNCWKLAP